ncbi:zinc finger protein 91 [Aedes albopictus]|uniref:C2H2-type domain-containing protein n=1 Tax=Aedes albopictus TaxID=7160 RepID=A0ABM1Y4R2_AEDAL|nr:zinc finger protein 91-like [Aedes albopictus]
MTEALEDCLTCRRKTDNFLRITDESQSATAAEDIGNVIANHFWFQANQYENRVLCTSCWEKIDDFHKFYCEVKQIWDQDGSFSNTAVKKEIPFEEDGFQTDLFAASELVKIEITPANEGLDSLKKGEDDSTFEEDIPDESDTANDSDDSDEESSVPIAKRFRRGKGETTSLKVEKPTRKKRSRSSNVQSLKLSKDASPFQCDLCDPPRAFRKEEGLQMHQVICHSDETEKTFQCDQCEKAFASEWQLSGHKRWHETMSLNIRCVMCNKYFDSGRSLKYHIQANHSESKTAVSSLIETIADQPPSILTEMAENSTQMPKTGSYERRLLTPEEHAQHDELIRKFCTLVCDRCGFAGENFYDLEKHCKNVHSVRGYAGCCGRRFYKKRQLFEHCQWHIDPDTFHCEPCKKSFPDSEALEKHNQWIHMPDSEKPFKCEICDAVFYKEYLLKNHMKYHLSIEKKIYFCKDCDRSFGAPSYLRTHLQAMHGAASSWVCDICAKGFSHKSLLETHRLTHTKEGAASLKRQCEHCQKWLKNAKSISRHVKRCLAGGPVTCELCGKEVANKIALASHKRLNHTEQPVYPCSFCGKIFKRIIRHREHEANHRGEVLYSCPFCPYTCNSNSNMYTHKKTAHTEQWTAKIAERFYKR